MSAPMSEDGRAVRRARVKQLFESGMTIQEVAADLGVCTRTIERDRAALGLAQARGESSRVSAAEVERMRAMAADGVSESEIARTLGRGYRSVRRHCPGAAWTHSQAGSWGRVLDRFKAVA